MRDVRSRQLPALMLLSILVVLSVGVGAWFAWPRTEARAEGELAGAAGLSVTPVSAPAPEETTDHLDANAETPKVALDPGTTNGQPDPWDPPTDSAETTEELDDSSESSTGHVPTSEDATTSTDTEDETPSAPAPASTPSSTGTEPEQPSTPTRRPRPKPVPKLDFVVRRGLAVGFAEIRLGRGRPRPVPPRGAATLRVSPGTYTLRYRTKADGPWKSIRHTFSSGMQYAGQLELTGLRIVAMPDKAG